MGQIDENYQNEEGPSRPNNEDHLKDSYDEDFCCSQQAESQQISDDCVKERILGLRRKKLELLMVQDYEYHQSKLLDIRMSFIPTHP
ncbi:Hypothetical protein NTJ_00396 [Nesidiocoris tenuis]|uniref:Uncharacterized protein n=1 Tax=Nesidiocoris tenuis TaxID=355587 RepID=A0ABN7A5V6_9HEMI|nr:Hypothetical protein NTJ_00396 [Nesidiocoris tenuis]